MYPMRPDLEAALARVDDLDLSPRPAPGQREKARAARKRVYLAIKAGRLVRGPCERASPDCSGRVEGHHDDYDKPLEVRWLCIRHHREVEREQGQHRFHLVA